MTTKITDVKGIYAELPYQDKILLKDQTFPGRDLLAMKLLGVNEDFIYKLENESGIDTAELIKKRNPTKNTYKLFPTYSKDIEVYDPEDCQSIVTGPINSTHLTMSWLKSVEENKSGNKQTIFDLENSGKLEDIAKKVLNYEGDDRFLNLIILLPITCFLESNNDEKIKLDWDVYEKVFNDKDSRESQLALLIALQILTLDKTDANTCFDIVKNTIFEKNFDGFDLTENNTFRYYIALKNHPVELIHTKVKNNCHGYIKDDFRNKNRSIVDKNIQLNKIKSSKKKNHVICDEDTVNGNVTCTKVNEAKRETGEYKLEREFETAAYGLRLIMSQVPGVLVNIKIPFTADYLAPNDEGDVHEKSETWVFGPKYWVELLQAAPKDPVDKDGIYDKYDAVNKAYADSAKTIHQFGDYINGDYLKESPKRKNKNEKK